MSSAKNLGTCNLKDFIKISGSSFRWGFIWDIPLLSWRLIGEILDEVSMKNLSCQLLMCYLTFWPSLRPIFKIHYGLISRQNLSTQPWSTWLCDPVTGTRWPRNGRRSSTTWSGSPNHLCTDTSDTSCTPPKMKPVPRPTTPALATTCQLRSWMMTSTSSMFRWGAVVLCSFLLLQTSNPAKATSCNSVLALIKSIILIPSYSILFLSILGRGRMKHPHLP